MRPVWNSLEELIDHPDFRYSCVFDTDDPRGERQFIKIGFGPSPDVEFEMHSNLEISPMDALHNLRSDASYTVDGFQWWCNENDYWSGDSGKRQIFQDMQSASKGLRQLFRHQYQKVLKVPEAA